MKLFDTTFQALGKWLKISSRKSPMCCELQERITKLTEFLELPNYLHWYKDDEMRHYEMEARYMACVREKINACLLLLRKLEEKTPLGDLDEKGKY